MNNNQRNSETEIDYDREDKTGELEEKRERIRRIDLENINDSGSVQTHNGCGIHTLVIAGQIEGHYALSGQAKSTKYEHVLPQLVEVEEKDELDGLLVILNTVGGDVEAGLAIAEMIAGMSKPTVSLVLGGGHSIGVPLAVSTKRSFIVPSATMTIHPVRTNGLVIGVPQTFTYFMRMQERILDFIIRHSQIEEKKLRSLMLETDELAADIGSVIDGREAVKVGLIDEVGGLCDALGCLRKMIKKAESGK